MSYYRLYTMGETEEVDMKRTMIPMIAVTMLLAVSCGPDPKRFESLKTPHLTNQPATLMLVAEFAGATRTPK